MKAKEVGNVLMIVGASAFAAGLGINITSDLVERHNRNKVLKIEKQNEAIRFEKEEHDSIILKNRAAAEREDLYKQKLLSMSDKEFAKHHAEATAKASTEALEEANRIKKNSEIAINTTKLECSDKIAEIQKICTERVEKAAALQAEAEKKYNDIDKLFYNRKEVLEARDELRNLIKKESKTSDDKEEILKRIERLL